MTFSVAPEAEGLGDLLEISREDPIGLLKDNTGCVLIYTVFSLWEPSTPFVLKV